LAPPKNLNSYIILYRIIANSGTIDLSNKKIKIESNSQQNAIEILRNTLEINNESTLRIDRIEQVNRKIEKEIKPKKSVFIWVGMGIFFIAGAARLLSKLL